MSKTIMVNTEKPIFGYIMINKNRRCMISQKSHYKLFGLILFLMLQLSCASKSTDSTELVIQEDNLQSEQDSFPRALATVPSSGLIYSTGLRCIFKDSKGNYWFGSHQEGACYYDGKTFNYFTITDGLSDNQVRKIEEGSDGKIWFTTAKGISSYDGQRITDHNKDNFGQSVYFPEQAWELSENDLWFGTGNQSGIYRHDGLSLHYLALPLPGRESEDKFSHYSYTAFTREAQNKIWIATYSALVGYDGKTFEIVDDEALGHSGFPETLHIRSLFSDSQGRLWIGNNGIGVLLADDKSIVNWSVKKGLARFQNQGYEVASSSPTLEHVFAIGEASDGSIWFGDRDTGAWRYHEDEITNYGMKDGLPVTHIWTIFQDDNGELLFGMGDGSICVFTGTGFETKW